MLMINLSSMRPVLRRVVFLVCFILASGLRKFDDSLLFRVDWSPDSGLPDEVLQQFNENKLPTDTSVVVSSVDDEQYVCTLPKDPSDNDGEDDTLKDIRSPDDLLNSIYASRSCTYRIEAYWTYEMCHGRFLRQYHEEKLANNKIKLQEYYLGQFIPEENDAEFDPAKPPKRKIEDQSLPYYPVHFVQGTLCDINNEPRTTRVLYVCIPEARNQIYSLDEVSSCEYEMVVLTSVLCSHPAFKPRQVPESKVECFPVKGAPPQPTSLTLWSREAEYESRAYKKHTVLGPNGQRFTSSAKAQAGSSPSPSTSSIKLDLQEQLPSTVVADDPSETNRPLNRGKEVVPPPSMAPADASLTNGFLSGEYCLYGGTGWWRHEYCHGRQVIQFHEDPKSGQRTEILLGMWNKEEHFRWIGEHSNKRPARVGGEIYHVSHYYGHGDKCVETGKDREVEVKLKCRQSAGSPNAVTLYLLEPKQCQYVLGVESKMLCDIIQNVDEDGLLFQ